jgi:hypothetical protein
MWGNVRHERFKVKGKIFFGGIIGKKERVHLSE